MDEISKPGEAAGKRQALGALVRSHAARLYGIALRITGQGDLAEDAVQETFVRVLEGRDPPPEPGAAQAWLARVVANQALEILRRRAARRRREERYAMTREETQDSRDPLHLSTEETEMVTIELNRLEPETRAAVWLHAVEGASLRDAAEALGSSRSTVSRRISSGLALLKARLEGRGLALRGAAPLPALLRSLPEPQAPPALLSRLDALAASLAQGVGGAAAAATAAPTGSAAITLKTLGGILMSGKKLAISIGLSALILGGAAVLVQPWTRGGKVPEIASRDAATPAAGSAPAEAAGPSFRDGAGGTDDPAAEPGGARSIARVSLGGRITNEDGEPVSKARVIALALDEWRRVGTGDNADQNLFSREELAALREAYRRKAASLPEASSDAGGVYSFLGLRPGDYRVLAAHPEYLPSVESRARVGAAPAVADIRLLRGATIEGRVVDIDGNPIGAAQVRAEPSGAPEGAYSGSPREVTAWESGLPLLAPGETVSGADGSFRIPSLEHLHHDVSAKKDGYLDGASWAVAAGSRDCAIVLDPGASVSGRIVDGSGAPVASADVELRPASFGEVHRVFDWGARLGPSPAGETRRAVSGEDGRFRISGLVHGAHDLVASKKGYSPAQRELDLVEEALDAGDVRLDAPRRISGTVYGPGRLPCPGARVLVPRPRKSVRGSNSLGKASHEAIAETMSDAEGRFVLEGVPEGSFGLVASKEGLETREMDGIEPGREGIEVVLGEGSRIFGKVMDPGRTKGIEGAEITAGFHQEVKTTSRADGTFEILGLGADDSRRGSAWVRARHPDHGSCSGQVAAAGTSREAPAILRLSRAGRLRGRVIDGAGELVGGAKVWIEVTGLTRDSLGWNPVSGVATVSSEDGSFTLAPPESLANTIGDLAIEVLAGDARFAPGRTGPLQLPKQGEDWPAVEIVLAEGGTIEGRVTDASGAGVARARVSARRPSVPGEGRASARGIDAVESVGFSAKDGAFVLRGVEMGPVELEVLSMSHARKTVAGLDVGSSPLRVDVVVESGGTLEGRVVDEEGSPMPGVEVAAFLEESSERGAVETVSEFAERMEKMTVRGRESARTADDGRFVIRRLPAGSYRIIARTVGFEPAELTGAKPADVLPDLTLLRYSAIRGRVLDGATRRPLRTFVVEVINKKRRIELQKKTNFQDSRLGTEGSLRFEDPLGRFAFDGLRPAEYAVTVAAEGYVSSTRDVVLATGTELPIEFLLDAGGRISGVIRDGETGRPVEGAVVNLGYDRPDPDFYTGRFLMEDVVTAADGSFTISGLREGKYHVGASHPYYRPQGQMASVEVRSTEAAEPMEVLMSPAGRIEIEIEGMPRGHPRKRSLRHSVSLAKAEDAGGEEERGAPKNPWAGFVHVQQDASGRFYAESLDPGTYSVSLKVQEMEEGDVIQLGPMGGFSASRPKGEEKVVRLGDVEVRPRETAYFEGKVP